MIRLIGALLLVGGTTSIGIRAIWRLGQRVRILSELIKMLDLMEAEITFHLTPMPELIPMLLQNANGPVGGFLKNVEILYHQGGQSSFSRAWQEGLKSTGSLELQEKDQQALESLGAILGRYDSQEQAKAIAYSRRRLSECLREAEEVKKRQSKVYGMLGVVSGIACVVILF